MMTAEKMRVRLGLSADDGGMDTVIEQLLVQADAYARAYCRLRDDEDVPAWLIAQMAAEDYGRLDGAGVSSRSLSGLSETYRSQYSEGITAILRSMRHPGGAG